MSGRESLEADDGERRNFHRFARAPPATRRHAGHISPTATSQVTASLHDFAGSLAPGSWQKDRNVALWIHDKQRTRGHTCLIGECHRWRGRVLEATRGACVLRDS